MALFKKKDPESTFCAALDAKKVVYTKGDGRLIIKYNADNFSGQAFTFFFDDDHESAALRVFSICEIPKERIAAALLLCNELNNKWRWFRFYIDEDREVTMAADVKFSMDNCAEVCYEILQRGVQILDDEAVAPKFAELT